jgi:hypothetical protein
MGFQDSGDGTAANSPTWKEATGTGGKPTTHKKMDPKTTRPYLASSDSTEPRRRRFKRGGSLDTGKG